MLIGNFISLAATSFAIKKCLLMHSENISYAVVPDWSFLSVEHIKEIMKLRLKCMYSSRCVCVGIFNKHVRECQERCEAGRWRCQWDCERNRKEGNGLSLTLYLRACILHFLVNCKPYVSALVSFLRVSCLLSSVLHQKMHFRLLAGTKHTLAAKENWITFFRGQTDV